MATAAPWASLGRVRVSKLSQPRPSGCRARARRAGSGASILGLFKCTCYVYISRSRSSRPATAGDHGPRAQGEGLLSSKYLGSLRRVLTAGYRPAPGPAGCLGLLSLALHVTSEILRVRILSLLPSLLVVH